MAALTVSQNMHRMNVLWEKRRCLLETNVGVSNQEGAENGVHDRVEGAGGEGSDGKGNQANADSSVGSSVSTGLGRSVKISCRTSRTSSGSYPPWGGGRERERGRSLSKSIRMGFNGRPLSRIPPKILHTSTIEEPLGVCLGRGARLKGEPRARKWFGYSRHTSSFKRLCTSDGR